MSQLTRKSELDTPKKPYTTPQVQIYGDLRDVTQSAMMNNLTDNGPGANNRTS